MDVPDFIQSDKFKKFSFQGRRANGGAGHETASILDKK
jgi:hypothetical protein